MPKGRPKKKANTVNRLLLMEAYNIPKWHEIAVQKITEVANEILGRLREMDEQDIFALPVAEAFPDVANDYDAVIGEPMDFRTIMEDRLPYYESITQLQGDLVLIFTNCMAFNEEDSALYETGSALLGNLEKLYGDVCSDLRVRIRHH